MEINGRKIGLLFSTGAKYEIGQLGADIDQYMRTVKSAVILSKYFDLAAKYSGTDRVRPLEEAEIMALTDEEFTQLCDEIMVAFKAGNDVTVEAEEDKKKENEASS